MPRSSCLGTLPKASLPIFPLGTEGLSFSSMIWVFRMKASSQRPSNLLPNAVSFPKRMTSPSLRLLMPSGNPFSSSTRYTLEELPPEMMSRVSSYFMRISSEMSTSLCRVVCSGITPPKQVRFTPNPRISTPSISTASFTKCSTFWERMPSL